MTVEKLRKTASDLGYPCIIPIVRALRNHGELLPTDVYFHLRKDGGHTFLLESAELGEKVARYSFVGSKPEKVIRIKNGEITVNCEKKRSDDPLTYLANQISRYNVGGEKLPKFFGGLLGYFSYDSVRYFEDIGEFTGDDLNEADAEFIFVKNLCAFDHWRDEILIVSNMILESSDNISDQYQEAMEAIDGLEELIKKVEKNHHQPSAPKSLTVESNFEKSEFEMAVKIAKEHIYAGDIFQVVLSQRFKVAGEFDPFSVYLSLKEINPSPYMYLLEFDETKIIGSSPEILVKVDENAVTVRPIAGTRPRGENVVEDEALAREMVNDEKERAEHVMLVDLGRNDVGRVSSFGSVEVTEFFGIEKYSHVQHIISNVKGELTSGLDSFDALKATFPAGTVTGAPKIRAMQIIEELEPSRRGVYAGSVGYFCFNGDMDFAITIRTIVIEGDAAYVQAGAGIVADSVPEREYEETLNKGRGMLKALEMAGERDG
jgi:anthranilate synthase component 1